MPLANVPKSVSDVIGKLSQRLHTSSSIHSASSSMQGLEHFHVQTEKQNGPKWITMLVISVPIACNKHSGKRNPIPGMKETNIFLYSHVVHFWGLTDLTHPQTDFNFTRCFFLLLSSKR